MRFVLFAVLALTASAYGQVKGLPEKIDVTPGVPKRLTLELTGDDVDFADSPGFFADRLHSADPKKVRVVIFPIAKSGTYTLSVFTATAKDNKGVLSRQDTVVVIGNDPKPPPPPDPVDPVNPPPIAGDGLKVIIVFEKKEQMKLTPGQLNAMHGIEMYDYMKSKSGQWYVADKDNTGANLTKEWSDALKRPRKTLPWIIVSNGKTGFEGELPKTTEDILALIKKYGGE